MRAVNTFLSATFLVAIAMVTVHYAVVSAISIVGNRCQPEEVRTEVVKLDPNASAKWIEEARKVAHRIADENGTVTVDDIWNECPAPEGMDGRRMMAAFPRSEWEVVGRVQSTRDVNHGRFVAQWARKSDARAAA